MIGKLSKKGFSLFEMVIVIGMLGMLAFASVPVAELAVNKIKEEELQANLEAMREAIALWQRDCRNAVVQQAGYNSLDKVEFWRLCPPALEYLVTTPSPDSNGVINYEVGNVTNAIIDMSGKQIATFTPRRYLEAIPIDPFVGRPCWKVHTASGTCDAAYGFREDVDGLLKTRGYLNTDWDKGSLGVAAEGDWHGVFDVSCIASNAVDPDDYYTRRGYNVAVDGTNFEDW